MGILALLLTIVRLLSVGISYVVFLRVLHGLILVLFQVLDSGDVPLPSPGIVLRD